VFATQVKKCSSYGAKAVYLVDSAGGMLPEQIKQYADAVRDIDPDIRLGFHGHNNLGMAVANSLFCAEYGFSIVDTSLQGLGRSSGNAPSSQFISVLMRAGFDVPYDVVDVMAASEELARPYKREAGYDTLEMTAGLALYFLLAELITFFLSYAVGKFILKLLPPSLGVFTICSTFGSTAILGTAFITAVFQGYHQIHHQNQQ
jgi:hypothetical protein